VKRLFVLGLTALGFALFPAFAGAGGPYDSVTGAGWRGPPFPSGATILRHFEVSAHDGPDGVTGQFSEEWAHPNSLSGNAANLRGDVKCLVVTGNEAVVGGVITSSDDPAGVGTGFAIGFRDNVSPTPDEVTLTDLELLPFQTAADCAAASFLLFALSVEPFARGNVVVYGAS
jgi:hypothetical protein